MIRPKGKSGPRWRWKNTRSGIVHDRDASCWTSNTVGLYQDAPGEPLTCLRCIVEAMAKVRR